MFFSKIKLIWQRKTKYTFFCWSTGYPDF